MPLSFVSKHYEPGVLAIFKDQVPVFYGSWPLKLVRHGDRKYYVVLYKLRIGQRQEIIPKGYT